METLPSEREFDEAFVIFYDASGKYVAHASNNTPSTSSVGSFEVIKPPTVELGTPYKVLIVANMKYYLDPAYVNISDYINANKTLNYDAMQSEIEAMSNNRVFRKLPMYAQADITLTSSGIIPVTFARAVARIDIAVARCGPGDGDLTGTITIEGCDAAGKVVPDGARYTIPLKIYSSLRWGFTQIGNITSGIIYHDRNIGAPESNIGDESKITIPALTFSNYSGDYQSVDKEGVKYMNIFFKGSFHTAAQANIPANALCPEGWRMPTKDEFGVLATQMQWAKAGYRPDVVANKGEHTGVKGCYFSLAGIGTNPSSTYHYYWAGPATPISAPLLVLTTTNASASNGSGNGQYLVRCVRDI